MEDEDKKPAREPRAGKLVDDMQNGDAVTKAAWLERRKEQSGWRNGARVRKIDQPK